MSTVSPCSANIRGANSEARYSSRLYLSIVSIKFIKFIDREALPPACRKQTNSWRTS